MIDLTGVKHFCNDNISEHVTEKDLKKMQRDIEKYFQKVLESLKIDTENDHNTQETAKRVAKMMVREVFAGRYEPKPRITSFPNATAYDELYLTGPIKIRSTCAHHSSLLLVMHGSAYFLVKMLLVFQSLIGL